MAFMVKRVGQGSGITVDWSLCALIDRLPGSAMFAVKFEIDRSPSRNSSTYGMTVGCTARSANTRPYSIRS